MDGRLRRPTRNIAVQRWENQVRWRWPRCDATAKARSRRRTRAHWRRVGARRPRVHASRGDSSSCHHVMPSMCDRRRVRTRTHAALTTPTCAARCCLDARDRLAAGGRVVRSSASLSAADTTIRACDVHASDAIGLPHPLDSHRHTIPSCDTHDEVPLACAGPSVGCDGRRRLGRVRPHPVCEVGVPPGARPGHGGEPA